MHSWRIVLDEKITRKILDIGHQLGISKIHTHEVISDICRATLSYKELLEEFSNLFNLMMEKFYAILSNQVDENNFTHSEELKEIHTVYREIWKKFHEINKKQKE